MSLATVRLGSSDLAITRVGIGTAPIGSTPDWRIYWGLQGEADAIRAIEAAIDRKSPPHAAGLEPGR